VRLVEDWERRGHQRPPHFGFRRVPIVHHGHLLHARRHLPRGEEFELDFFFNDKPCVAMMMT